MSFVLFPYFAWYFTAFALFVGVVAAASVTVLAQELSRNRAARLTRRESIPTYYRHLLAH